MLGRMVNSCAVCISDRYDGTAVVVPLRLARCEHVVHLSCLARALLRESEDPRRQDCPVCRRPLNLEDMLLIRDELFPSAGDLPTTAAAAAGSLTGERLQDFRKISGFVAKFRLLEESSDDDDDDDEDDGEDEAWSDYDTAGASSSCSWITDEVRDHRGD